MLATMAQPPKRPTPPSRRRLALAWWLGACLTLPPWAWAQSVTCHLGYAGVSRSFHIPPSHHTDDVAPLVEGASFSFKVLNRLPPDPGAGVQVQTYAVFANEPFLIHQATYTPTQAASGPHGFTGLQVVREPWRANELSYWCERSAGR